MRTFYRWVIPAAATAATIWRRSIQPRPISPLTRLGNDLSEVVATLRDLSLGQQMLAEIDTLAKDNPWPEQFDHLRDLFMATSLGSVAAHLPPIDEPTALV